MPLLFYLFTETPVSTGKNSQLNCGIPDKCIDINGIGLAGDRDSMPSIEQPDPAVVDEFHDDRRHAVGGADRCESVGVLMGKFGRPDRAEWDSAASPMPLRDFPDGPRVFDRQAVLANNQEIPSAGLVEIGKLGLYDYGAVFKPIREDRRSTDFHSAVTSCQDEPPRVGS